MVGAFHQPRLVYMNLSTLSSLPAEQFACGMGEILKTGLICDGDFFRYVCCEQKGIKKLDMEQIARMVRRCCEIKAGVVGVILRNRESVRFLTWDILWGMQ